MSARTDQARKLELSGVQEAGDFVTGRARGLGISLEGEPPFSACVVELAGAIPIAQMLMRAGDLNHPDAVETGDGRFDERMQVMALETYAPTLQNEPRATLPASPSRIKPWWVVGMGIWGAVSSMGIAALIGFGLESATLVIGAMGLFIGAVGGALKGDQK